jgi:hypothetical protein
LSEGEHANNLEAEVLNQVALTGRVVDHPGDRIVKEETRPAR